jgi:uncharacterized membrane protein YphA (DoxX/SURF4 family)
MFPSGLAGFALIVLRAVAAVGLLVDGTAHWAFVTSPWMAAVFLAPAASLFLGLATPFCAIVAALIGIATALLTWHEMTGRQDWYSLCVFIVISAVVTMLGPGAYSLDARIFGRRVIRLPRP